MPQVSRLTVRGFKSIRSLESLELGRLNVLIGANGAGKSNLMGVFRMLSAAANGRLQTYVREQGGADALLYGGLKRTSQLEVGLRFAGDDGYRVLLEAAAAGALVFAGEELVSEVDGVDVPQSLGEGHQESRLGEVDPTEFSLAPYVLESLPGWRVFHFPDTTASAPVKQPQPARGDLRLKADAANLAPMLRLLRDRYPENYQRIVETVRQVAPFFGGFVHRDNTGSLVELEWYELDDPDTVRGPHQLSDGTLRFMCLATLLLQPRSQKSDTILIDEPELGLHPYALAVLVALLEQAGEETQVIVSTQSPELVSGVDPADVIVAGRTAGESTYERLTPESLVEWLKDYSLGELWKMNVIGGRPSR
jgi:predicted ATPase